MILLLAILALVVIGIGCAIRLLTRPMTCCLTFDDGLKVHAEIAAPLLEKFGWRGTFNIPTSFMDPSKRNLTACQANDCRLTGHEDNLMDWQDVNGLLASGHEVYPHTLEHADLLQLEKAGSPCEIRRQVREAKSDFIRHTRTIPAFFCSPHNSTSPLIEKLIHDNGMEILGLCRANYGSVVAAENQLPIDEYLRLQHRQGASSADIAIHGIDRTRGGWRPFETVADFEQFLEKIKTVEAEGLVRLTTYSRAHRRHTALAPFLRLGDRMCAKLRREVYSFVNRHSSPVRR